jgi:hypothetical protein
MIQADNELFLDVTGGVSNSTVTSGHTASLLMIDGEVKNTRFSGETTGTFGASVSGSEFVSREGSAISLTIGGGFMKSTLESGGVVSLSIGSGVSGSRIVAIGDSANDNELLFNIGGSVTKSRFEGDTTGTVGGGVSDSFFTGSEFADVSLVVGASLSKTTIETDNEIVVSATGSVVKSHLVSSTGGVSVTAGGSLLGSTLISSDDDISLAITGDVLDNTFLTDDSGQSWTGGSSRPGRAT